MEGRKWAMEMKKNSICPFLLGIDSNGIDKRVWSKEKFAYTLLILLIYYDY